MKPTAAKLSLRREKRALRQCKSSRAHFAKLYLSLCADVKYALADFAIGEGSVAYRVALLRKQTARKKLNHAP